MFTSNRDEELYFLEKYRDSREWNKMLPRSVLDVLGGRENGGSLYDRYLDTCVKGERTRHFWFLCLHSLSCTSCGFKIPDPFFSAWDSSVFSSEYRSCGGERWWIFGRNFFFYKKANPLELHVRCRCCGGFLGILAPCTEIESDASSRAIFAVNSCCLEFIRGSHTQCCLDGVYGGDEDGASDGGIVTVNSLDGGEINFDDPNIFEM
ncbi:hypothetical protein TcBrA4_0045680 [Trypanosoma cruzi]|nr:hypothetical protein TcBrA4_0045680 [Trypanosoma cruzi]